MMAAYLVLTAFLALVLWRVVLAGLARRPLARPADAPQARHNDVTAQLLSFSARSCAETIPDNGLDNGPERIYSGSKKERAERYLFRIVALTGAAPMGNGYVLNVGATRFHVREGFVGQLRDLNDPKCTYKETCFYCPNKEMPKIEQVATALLELASNPALFDKWAAQDGLTFKADGQVFTRIH